MSGRICYTSALSTPYKMMNNKEAQPIIRRTLSADMSSPKWLLHHGSSSAMNRAQSSDRLQALGEEDDLSKQQINGNDNDKTSSNEKEEKKREAFEDIWSSVQAEKRSWTSILTSHHRQSYDGSGSGSGQLPPPYIHPLVRRSASSLSEKSLEICTESLGSETGSDGFSYLPSDPQDESDHQRQDELELFTENNNVEEEDQNVLPPCNKYYPPSKRCPPSPSPRPRSFPPLLSSLVHRHGSNLHMRSHRHHGRLVLEAVSVPSQTCSRAHRHNGRLLLTLSDAGVVDDDFDDEQEDTVGQEVEEIGEAEEVEDEEEEEEAGEKGPISSNGLTIDVHQSSSGLIMNKLLGFPRTQNNSTWRRTINATVIRTLDSHSKEKSLEKNTGSVAQLIRSVGPTISTANVATTATLNTNEYYWRRSTTVAVLKPLVGQQKAEPQVEKEKEINKLVFGHKGKSMSLGQQRVVLVKAEGKEVSVATGEKEVNDEYLVPSLRGCKEQRKTSLLFLEPYCIATS